MASVAPPPNDLVRLHITPFNPTIYEKIIPAAFRRPGQEVSFHAVQTFPERGFGYLELAKADADALKRKLQGSMLKGTKMRIEEAKPVKKRKIQTVDEPTSDDTHKKRVKTQSVPQSKPRDVVLQGHELSADRHVKRGWTEEKTGKRPKITPAAGSRDKKLLFKTVVPANVKPLGDGKSRNKKPKEKRAHRAKKGETVVEEFSKNRSTFAVSHANSVDRKPAVAYEDGLGWVNEDSEVVEPETKKLQHLRQQLSNTVLDTAKPTAANPSDDRVLQTKQVAPISTSQPAIMEDLEDVDMDDEDSSTSDDEPASETSEESDDEPASETSEASDDGSASEASDDSSAASLGSTSMNEAGSTTDVPEIHPLEALYKRPAVKADAKTQLAPINTFFSFFNAEDDAAEDVSMVQPQTPHTKQDLEWRHQRSAAPTPDTAAIDGRFGFPFGDSDEEDDDITATPIQPPAIETQRPETNDQQESAFRKFFYEKRGDTDRAWKKRRREAKKLQRQRENRRLSRKVV